MSQSPRLSDTEPSNGSSQTTKQSSSASVVILMTALDTTWRAFVPTLGGTFAGIGLDAWLHIAPFGVIGCLILGTALSALLITQQLINVRKPLR
jgi:F0F1-type ATP synthase assembly protein I